MKNRHLENFWARCKAAWFRWADVNQHAAWFPWFIAAMVAVDAIVVVLPGDALVALAALSNRPKWLRTALAAGLGGALGAFALYSVVKGTGGSFLNELQQVNAGLGVSDSWEKARGFFNQYGLASLALGSLVPLMSWPPVVLAGLASSAPLPVLGYLILGRLARYILLCAGVRFGWSAFEAARGEARRERDETLRR